MQSKGLRMDQVSQVRGYADQKLRKPDVPFDASNRRISVIVHYVGKTPGTEAAVENGKSEIGAKPKGESEEKEH